MTPWRPYGTKASNTRSSEEPVSGERAPPRACVASIRPSGTRLESAGDNGFVIWRQQERRNWRLQRLSRLWPPPAMQGLPFRLRTRRARPRWIIKSHNATCAAGKPTRLLVRSVGIGFAGAVRGPTCALALLHHRSRPLPQLRCPPRRRWIIKSRHAPLVAQTPTPLRVVAAVRVGSCGGRGQEQPSD